MKDACRLAWHRITPADVHRIKQELAARYEASTANRALTALRRVLEASWLDELLTTDRYQRLVKFRRVRGESMPRGRALSDPEIKDLYLACEDGTATGARDAMAIALMHAAGLRAAEAASLCLEDVVDEATGELLVPGKGGTLAGASLGAGSVWLAAWLAVRGRAPGPLLYQMRSNGKVAPLGLCAAAMWQIVKKRVRMAGLRRCSPHDLRKTFATALLRAGYDHLLVMRALRHRDLQSVAKYDRRSDEERAAAQRATIRVPAPRITAPRPGGGHS